MILTRKLRLSLLLVLVLFVAGAMLTKGAYATAYTWNGGGDGTTWEDGNNWNPNAPAGGPVAGDSATIDLAAANVTIAGTTTVSKLTIGGTNTSTLTLGGNNLNVTYVDATYNGDLTIGTNGTLVASTGTPIITVEGDWDSSAGTFSFGTSTVVLTGAGNNLKTVDSLTVRFYNLTIDSGASITLISNSSVRALLTISGTLTIPSGLQLLSATVPNNLTINAGGELTGAGTFKRMVYNGINHITNDGTISVSTFIYAMSWSSSAAAITATTYGGNLIIQEYDANQSSIGTLGGGSGTLVVDGNLTVEHNGSPGYSITLSSGSVPVDINGNVTIASDGIINAGSSSYTVSGNWTNNGIFTAGSSSVNFDGTGTQDITSGSDPFNTLIVTNSTSDVTFMDSLTTTNFTSNIGSVDMRFNAGSTYTITNLTLNGALGNPITLRSTVPGMQWVLNVSGTQSLSYVDVADSNASGGSQIICTTGCTGAGSNNDNWIIQLVSIPTMTEWGMIIFMLLAGLWAVYYLPAGRQV